MIAQIELFIAAVRLALRYQCISPNALAPGGSCDSVPGVTWVVRWFLCHQRDRNQAPRSDREGGEQVPEYADLEHESLPQVFTCTSRHTHEVSPEEGRMSAWIWISNTCPTFVANWSWSTDHLEIEIGASSTVLLDYNNNYVWLRHQTVGRVTRTRQAGNARWTTRGFVI